MIKVGSENINRIIVSQDQAQTDLLRVLKPQSVTEINDTDMLWFGANSYKTAFANLPETDRALYFSGRRTDTTYGYTTIPSSGFVLEFPNVSTPSGTSQQGASIFSAWIAFAQPYQYLSDDSQPKISRIGVVIDVSYVGTQTLNTLVYVRRVMTDGTQTALVSANDTISAGGSLSASLWIADDFRIRSTIVKRENGATKTTLLIGEAHANQLFPVPLQSKNLSDGIYSMIDEISLYGMNNPTARFAGYYKPSNIASNYILRNSSSTIILNGVSLDGSIDFENRIY